MNNVGNYFDLVLAMFNQYLFQDCKNNIRDLKNLFKQNMATSGNKLIEDLLQGIEDYSFENIGMPFYDSVLAQAHLTPAEVQEIKNKIVQYKQLTPEQIEPCRKQIKNLIAKEYIDRADRLYKSQGDGVGFIEYIKNLEFKTSKVDSVTERFDTFDINTIVSEVSLGGIPSKFDWINNTFQPECCYPKRGLMCVSQPPGCMSGNTEVFLADGTTDTLENIHKKGLTNITVYSCDGNDPKVSVAENCQISKYVDSWYVVEIDGKKEYRVTDNHPFLMIDGSWVKAEDLKIGDILMPFNKISLKSKETDESCGSYSYIYTNNSRKRFKSHLLTKEYICNKDPNLDINELIVHHSSTINGKFNRSNDTVEAIKLMSANDHRELHANIQKNTSCFENFLEGGKKTRFTSEQISNRNKENWKDPEYRNRMAKVSYENGKKVSKVLNSNLPGYNGQKSKVLLSLKYGKELIEKLNLTTTEELLNSWDDNRNNSNISCISPRVPSRESVEKYFSGKINELYDDCLSYNNHTITNVYVEHLDTPQPVYDMVNVDLYHNYAVKFDETSGFFSHNTGKTLFCMQECLNMCLQGYKCHYLCMGDMNQADFIVRMAAQYTGLPFYEVKKDIKRAYDALNAAIGKNLFVKITAAGELTVDEYIEDVKDKDYDVLFIDYDSNFKSNVATDMMYLVYGEIYDKLSELSVKYNKLVFILAQPIKQSWSLPVIEIDQIGESAKKIHVVDWCMTRAREPGNVNGLGTSKIVKSRRGEEQVVDYNIRLNNGRFKSLPRAVFQDLCQVQERKNWGEAEIDQMIQQYLQSRGVAQNRTNARMQQMKQQSSPFSNP